MTKIKISVFAILVAFITTIAISCSDKATEPQISASLNSQESVKTVDINSLLGKTFRSEKAYGEAFYIYVKITDTGKIMYKVGDKTKVSFANQDEIPLSEGIRGDNMVSYQFEGKPMTTTEKNQKGILQVKPDSVSIVFTGGNSYTDMTFNLIEIEIIEESSTNTTPSETPTEEDSIKNYIGITYESISRYSFAGYGTFKYTAKLTEYETGKYRLELTGGQYDNRKPVRDKAKDKNDGSKAFTDWETHFIKFSEDGNTLYFTPNTWSRPIEMKKIK